MVYGWSRIKEPPKMMCFMRCCCAHMHPMWPMLLDTIRRRERATSCARKFPHMATDAARASANRMIPNRSAIVVTPGRDLRMKSMISQKPCQVVCMHACTYACMPEDEEHDQSEALPRMHACTLARMPACPHARMPACPRARMPACPHAHAYVTSS